MVSLLLLLFLVHIHIILIIVTDPTQPTVNHQSQTTVVIKTPLSTPLSTISYPRTTTDATANVKTWKTINKDKHYRRRNRNIQLDITAVVTLSNTTLTQDESQLLAKRLSFCPISRYINWSINWTEVRVDFNDFSRHETPRMLPRLSHTTSPPYREPALDTFLDAVEKDILNITPRIIRNNLTELERQAIATLKRRDDIIVKSADKRSATVIMDKNWYINECLRQLNDTALYRPLFNDITDDIQKRVTLYSERMVCDQIINSDTKRFFILMTLFMEQLLIFLDMSSNSHKNVV